MSRAGERILRSARQALAYAEGRANRSKFRAHVPDRIDVRAVRRKIGMSQDEFARQFGVSKRTVQDSEQSRRRPEGPARLPPRYRARARGRAAGAGRVVSLFPVA